MSGGTASGEVDVDIPSGQITGLTPGATYEVSVAVGNGIGLYSADTTPLRIVASNGVDGNGDGLADDWVAATGVSNAAADADSDGASNGDEFSQGSNPNDQDSDEDGFSDGEEKAAGTDPLQAQSFAASLSQPRLGISEKNLSFLVKKQSGGEAAPQLVKWSNLGGGNLQLQASSAEGWIETSVSNGEVQVGIDSNTLTPGFYSGVVKLNAAAGSDPLIGGAACVRVNAWVLRSDSDIPSVPVENHAIYLPLVLR